MRDTGIESVSAGQPEEERESLQAGGRTLPFDHPRCSAATCSVSVVLAASASRGRSVAICTVVLARDPHRVGTDSPRDGSGCGRLRGGDRRGHLWQLERSSQSVRGGLSRSSFGTTPNLRARPNRRILTTFHVRLGHSGLCVNLLQKHRT